MQLDAWVLILPVVQVAVAVWLMRVIDWRRYHTLIPLLFIMALCETIYYVCPLKYRGYCAPAEILVLIVPLKIAVAFEVAQISSVTVSSMRKLVIITVALEAAFVLALCAYAMTEHMSVWYLIQFFEQYFFQISAAVLTLLWIYRQVFGVWDSHARRFHATGDSNQAFAFRTINTIHMIRTAFSTSVIEDGICKFLYQSRHTVDNALWISAIVTCVIQGIWMTWHYSSRVPVSMRSRINNNRKKLKYVLIYW